MLFLLPLEVVVVNADAVYADWLLIRSLMFLVLEVSNGGRLKIRIYHTRTMFWTYLVWAILSLLAAVLLCIRSNCPLARLPLVWVGIHYAPWKIFQLDFYLVTGLAALSVISGLLIKGRWARILVIIGISIWFLWGMCIVGMEV